MFDVSLVELAVIALVALLVLGPERLPRAARTVGLYMRKARQSWYSVRADIERELAADELKRSIKRSGEEIRESIGLDAIRNDLRPKRLPQKKPVSTEQLPEQVETASAAAGPAANGAPDDERAAVTAEPSSSESDPRTPHPRTP